MYKYLYFIVVVLNMVLIFLNIYQNCEIDDNVIIKGFGRMVEDDNDFNVDEKIYIENLYGDVYINVKLNLYIVV